MSGAPQFPIPSWVGAQPLRPGGAAHKAGPTLEQRIEALERGALGRPGPGVVDGCTITSDIASQGGAKWGVRARHVLAAQAQSFASGLTTTSQVIGPGALRAESGCGDAIFFRYNSSEWTIGGVAPTFVFVSTMLPNATAPGVTINAYVSVLTALNGGAGSVGITSTSTITNAHASMTAGTISQTVSAATTLTSGDTYVFRLGTASGSQAANSAMASNFRLYATYPA